MLKAKFMELILSISEALVKTCLNLSCGTNLSLSGAAPRKDSNRNSWMSFCRLLELVPENIQIEVFVTNFVDFLRLGQKGMKSEFLEVILSISGADTKK